MFDLIKDFTSAYDQIQFKTFIEALSKLSPALKQIGAIRCFYICQMAQEIRDKSQLRQLDPNNSLWRLYPAFIEFWFEYMYFLDYKFKGLKHNNESNFNFKTLVHKVTIS